MVDERGAPPDDRRGRRGERVPPHNLEAEASLLGAMLLSRDAVAASIETVEVSHFYRPIHQMVFDAMLDLYRRSEAVDVVSVHEELRRRNELETVGGPAFLGELAAAVPATTNAAHYAKIVREAFLLRELIRAGREIAEMGFDPRDEVPAIVDRAEDIVYQVAQGRSDIEFSTMSDLIHSAYDLIERRYDQKAPVTGLSSGFPDLDKLTMGFSPGNLIMVAARPSLGKTTLALNFAANAALRSDPPQGVAIFSLEMSSQEVAERFLCSEAKVDTQKVRTGFLSDTDWPKITRAAGRLESAPIFVDESPFVTVLEMRAKCRRIATRHPLGLVIVDYVQLMEPRDARQDNRATLVAEISRGLKVLARELQVPVITCAQLNRAPEARTDKRPLLGDLRESGCLTADTVVWRADTGAPVTMGALLLSQERDIPVWTLNDDLKLVPGTMTHVFPSGRKEVFELRLASGQVIKASANHPFLTFDGWRRLDELSPKTRIAVPRALPPPMVEEEWPDDEVILLAHLIGDGCFASGQPIHYTSGDQENIEAVDKAARSFGVSPRLVRQRNWWHLYLGAPGQRVNPIRAWLRRLGVDGLRSKEKFIPRSVFALSSRQLALFVRHIWATDGHLSISDLGGGKSKVNLYYASSSRRLVDDLAMILLRLDIRTKIRPTRKEGYQPTYHLTLESHPEQSRFGRAVGIYGRRGRRIPALLARSPQKVGARADTVPAGVWSDIRHSLSERGESLRSLARALGVTQIITLNDAVAPTRTRVGEIAEVLDDPGLARLAQSTVFWDSVKAIVSLGEQPVFDATVAGSHNFIANGVIVENSLEQDSDIVLFIYRDSYYNPDSPDKGLAEIIISKNRNGPTGTVKLSFLDHCTRFESAVNA